MPDQTAGEHRRPHRKLVLALTILASILLTVTAANTWVKRQVLDTDAWVSTAEDLLVDDEVSAALSKYVVDQLYANVDVQAQLEERLPNDLDGLAGPIAAGLRSPAVEAVNRLIATGAAQEVWSRSNRRAHETLVNILRDETRPSIDTSGGTVTLDLRELVTRLADDIGLPGAVVDRIPEDVGTITVIESDQLETAQRAVAVIEWASVVLFVVIVALFAVAVYLAKGWRRVALRNVGIAVTIVALVILAGVRIGRAYVLDDLVEVPANRPVVARTFAIATELLRGIAWSGVALGVLIVLATVLVGPARASVWLRRRIGPALVANPGAVWGVTAAVVLLLVMLTPFDLFGTWLGVLGAAIVIIAGVEALRRTCGREARLAVDLTEA